MNQLKAVQDMSPDMSVLFIVPTDNYPGLLKVKREMFDALPKNARTKLYEPRSTHLNAPSASVNEFIDWTRAIAAGP